MRTAAGWIVYVAGCFLVGVVVCWAITHLLNR